MSFPGFTPVRLQGLRHPGLHAPHGRDQDPHPPQARGGGQGAAARRDAHRRRPGLRARRQARAANGEPARGHLGRLRARQARLQEALPLQGGRLPRRRALSLRGRTRARRQEALGGGVEAPHAPARACPPPGQGPRLVQERARRGARRHPHRLWPPTTSRASATSSRSSATASSSSAAPSRPPRPRAGHPPTTRAPPARPSTSSPRSTRSLSSERGSGLLPILPRTGLRRRSRRSNGGTPTRSWRGLRSVLPRSRRRLDELARTVGYHACEYDGDQVLHLRHGRGPDRQRARTIGARGRRCSKSSGVTPERAGVLAAHHRAARGGGGAAPARPAPCRAPRRGTWPCASASSTRSFARPGTLTVPGVPAFVASLARRACRARSAPRPRAGTWTRSWASSDCAGTSTSSSPPTTCGWASRILRSTSQAARRLGAPPADCLVFEDSLVGVEAARRAGHAGRRRHHRAQRRGAPRRRAPSGPSPTSRASSGRRSPAGKHAGVLAGPLRGGPGRLGARRARAGARGLARRRRRLPAAPQRDRPRASPCRARAEATTPASSPARAIASGASTWRPRPSTRRRRLAAAEGVDPTFEARDVFTLGGRPMAASSTAVWEYTCFCAIDPARREEYARVLHAILRPGGLLLACFYPLREGTDGPPFPVSRDEIERVLAPRLRSSARPMPPPRSVERRRGLEWLVLAERS